MYLEAPAGFSSPRQPPALLPDLRADPHSPPLPLRKRDLLPVDGISLCHSKTLHLVSV